MHYNGSKIFLYNNGVKIYQFNTKGSEIKSYILCLENISRCFSVNNLKKHGIKRYIYDFSFDYNTIDISIIVDTHKYLMEKHNVK